MFVEHETTTGGEVSLNYIVVIPIWEEEYAELSEENTFELRIQLISILLLLVTLKILMMIKRC